MLKFLTALIAGIGAGLLIGGVLGLWGSINLHETINVTGLGPLINARYSPFDFGFLSVCAASVGGALFTFGVMLRPR
jgi:hypothetical protein